MPYDCFDGDGHGPGNFGGQHAHWSLITGIIIAAADNLDITDVLDTIEDKEKDDKVFILNQNSASHVKDLCKSKNLSVHLIGRCVRTFLLQYQLII